MRFGISVTSGMRPKLLRIRFLAVGRSDMADLLRLNRQLDATQARRRRVRTSRRRRKGRAARRASGLVGSEDDNAAAAAAATACPARTPGRRQGRSGAVVESDLLDLHGGAGRLELRLDLGGLVLGDRLLDRLRRRLDQILGLLQAQAGDRADLLDDVDLLGAERRSGSRRTRSAPRPPRPEPQRTAASGRHRDRGRRRDAPLLLEHLRQLRRLEDGQARRSSTS